MIRISLIAATVAAIAAPTLAEDWKSEFKTLRFGVLSGENEKDRIQRYQPFEAYLEKTLGVDVEIFTASAYDGVIQALAADQIEFAFLGSSAYAAAWSETEGGVEPLLSRRQNDGSTGYYSIIAAQCDGPFKTLADLKGKVLAFADPDSTSGYQVPYYNLIEREQIDPATYFSATPFSGSHENGVIGVVNGAYDAAATYTTNETSGAIQNMVRKGMIDADKACSIWQSPEITSGPFTARTNLPEGLKQDMKAAVMDIVTADPEAFKMMTGGEVSTQAGWIEVDHDRYQWIVDMQNWLRAQRRG
ncbi:phosphonate ABC transporter substrate-binding protein [Rubrimonas sp.]|uniref:phosphonate ABC transporter substrate-binding protein n=1 Tax=Rubrimonas sp. TaxID=2036015 RepID=UPI002FDD95F3